MKFKKFLKGCGYHGEIVNLENGDKWLVYKTVAMRIPDNVITLVASGEAGGKVRNLIEAAIRADINRTLRIKAAYLPPRGNASDILRVFGNDNDEVAISNADYSLLEVDDYRYIYLKIADFDNPFLLVINKAGEVIGLIMGVLVQDYLKL